MMKHWTFRQVAICIVLIAASTIAFYDASMRDRFFELAFVVAGGYFGQMFPQSHK